MKKTVSFILMLCMAVLAFGCAPAPVTQEATPAPAVSTPEPEKGAYIPGTYSAIAKGHNEDFTIEVTFSEDEITDIVINENDETGYIGETSMNLVKEQILTYQTANVDTVSG